MTIRLTEHKTLHHQRLIAFILIIIAAAIVGYFAIASMYFTKEIAVVEPEPAIEIIDEFGDRLYFTAQGTAPGSVPELFQYGTKAKEWFQVFESVIFSSATVLTDEYVLGSIFDEQSVSEADPFIPALLSDSENLYIPLEVENYSVERDFIMAKANSNMIAYSVTNVDPASEEAYSLDSWSIVVSSLEDDPLVTTITEAARPQWIEEGSALLFLRSDGIYRYEIDTQEERLMIELDTELKYEFAARSEMAATSNGDQLVITSPNESKFLVFGLDEAGFYQPTYSGATDGGIYSSPLIRPDDGQVAMILGMFGGDENQAYADSEIQIFDISDMTSPSQVLGVPSVYDPRSLALVGWIAAN